jgi:hypothetical protein
VGHDRERREPRQRAAQRGQRVGESAQAGRARRDERQLAQRAEAVRHGRQAAQRAAARHRQPQRGVVDRGARRAIDEPQRAQRRAGVAPAEVCQQQRHEPLERAARECRGRAVRAGARRHSGAGAGGAGVAPVQGIVEDLPVALRAEVGAHGMPFLAAHGYNGRSGWGAGGGKRDTGGGGARVGWGRVSGRARSWRA